ncbi:MAG: hypothetical protein QY309_06950 [Cyclobacteriaceae bacterium]|nr:MAG: hypothetical protein QY309_06950 [Cyclobacteriaceae bacterium]
MESLESGSFLNIWHYAMIVGAIAMVAIGLLLYFIHHLKASSIKEYHHKYDYLNKNEIANYKRVFYCFGIAVAFAINTYGMGEITEIGIWFLVRMFMAIAGGTLVAYIAYLVLEYYYPTKLDKKLKKWRFAPRINPKSGNTMRLLSEEEEDVHLDAGMIAEENVFSIDYDVWIDEKTGDVKVEKYEGRLQALQCNSCGFYTMRVIKEEVTKMPDGNEPGELVKNYQCSYCKSVRATSFKISTKEADDYKKDKFKFKRNSNIDLVKVEIHSITGERKHFEFQNVDQAQKFLSEFES